MLRLGVNIDHVTTVREARYRGQLHGEPCPIEAIRLSEAAGAHGITAHLREDRRHIQDRDIWAIRDAVKTRLNFEMANTEEIVNIATKLKPETVCLVPENRNEVTTEGGLDVTNQIESIKATNEKLSQAGIEVSLFIDPDLEQIDYSKKSGAKVIELHTGSYADATNEDEKIHELGRIKNAAEYAFHKDMQVHAGHGLNLSNLSKVCRITQIEEINIGHSVVADSIFKGLKSAVQDFRSALDND